MSNGYVQYCFLFDILNYKNLNNLIVSYIMKLLKNYMIKAPHLNVQTLPTL